MTVTNLTLFSCVISALKVLHRYAGNKEKKWKGNSECKIFKKNVVYGKTERESTWAGLEEVASVH